MVSGSGPEVTWDGEPVTRKPPYGAAVVVFRRRPRFEILMLHRAHHGPDYDGDWAWTPPSGARKPGEPLRQAARRELFEEAGLVLEIVPTAFGTEEWAVFTAEADPMATIQLLDPEHDRFEWLSPAEVLRRAKPDVVREPLARVLASFQRLT